MENFCSKYHVSRETYLKLDRYRQSLIEWRQKFNLISKNTLDDIWNRHIEDSAQIFEYIPTKAQKLLDVGSGAGFPGMVVAIISAEKTPYLKITLVDSTLKKTVYLNHVKEITGISNTEILNCRVENITDKKFDVITARAVTSLDNLLEYVAPLLSKNGICIFLKGRSYKDEIDAARQHWFFDLQEKQSKTSKDGKILIISNIKKRRENYA